MGQRFDSLPKNVQKMVKRLADVQREELKVLRAHLPDEEARMRKLIDKGNKVAEELFCTRFAMEELGVCYPDSVDDLVEMGEFFLGEYALERLFAEENGEAYDEDLFYAGAYLKQSADMLADSGYNEFVDAMDDMEDDELDALVNKLLEKAGEEPPKSDGGRIVPLFGEGKDRKQ